MAITKKYLQFQDLTSIDTFTIDNRPESIYFNIIDLEETIPGGRSTFQILGSKYLTPEVELKIELIDRNGNPIYIEPIKYLGDKPSRHISVEIYKDTPTGVATLTILGSIERLADGTEIPDEWKGLYNVKWERNVFIDPTLKNTQPILFRGQAIEFKDGDKYPLPIIEVSEQVKGIVVPSGSGASETGFVTQSLFTGGKYEANTSPFDFPQDIRDAKTESKFGVSFPDATKPYEVSSTAYAVQKDNLTDGVEKDIGFDDEILNDDDFYEDHHSSLPKLFDYFPKEDDDVVEVEPDPPTPTLEPDFAGEGTLIKKTSGADFRSELAGGTFRAVPNVDFDLVKNVKGHTFTSSSFTASIVAVHSPELIEIDRPFTIANQSEFPDKNFKVPHNATSFEIDFRPAGQTQNSNTSVSETIFKSFAEVTVKNMKTFSGDVHRIKTFVKGYGEAASGFKLVSDKIVEASDVLTNRNSPTLRQKIGVFESQTRVHTNWTLKQHNYVSKSYAEGSYPVGDQDDGVQKTGSFQFGDTSTPPMMNGVQISGSNELFGNAIVFETKLSNLKVRPNTQYELKLRPILKVGQKFPTIENTTSVAQARVRFFISGSKINQDLRGFEKPQGSSIENSYAVGNMHLLGDPIRNTKGVISIESPKDSDVGELIDFGVVRIPFTPNFKNDVVVNNDTKLQIVVEAGELFLGRVELIPATDTSFNPDEFTFTAPMPKLRKRPEFFDLAVQFFDRNSNKAQYVPIKQAVKFDGENDVIQGTDNLLTGSLAIGNALGTGIEAAGVNSAYLRSVDYAGFDSASVSGQGGFLIFSGSVSRSLNTSESYDGVGLELHDGNSGSFKFRTKNADGVGEFDVRTNKFFFGKDGSQFVSGSDNQIEISSSNFHLRNDGNLIIGAGAVIESSLSANSILVPAGASTASAVASISNTGAARFVSASIGGFTVSETSISSSNSNLILRSSGVITASAVQVTGEINATGGGVSSSLSQIGVVTSSLLTASSSMAVQSVVTETGISLRKPDGQILADFGGNIELKSSIIGSQTTASLDTNALIFLKGGVTQSKFGVGEATIGVTPGSHFEVSGSGLRLKDGNVPRFAVDGNGVKVGNTSTSGFATQSFVGIDTFGVNFVKDGNSVGLFGAASLRLGATGLGLSQIEINASGDDAGTIFKDSDGKIVAVIGTATQTSGGTFGGGSRVIPESAAIRGMIVENIATNQAIVTGSISGSNLIAREINITGSANVGGLVTSGSVRNTSNGAATAVMIHTHNGSNTLFQVLNDGEVLARDNITAFKTSGFTSISDRRLKTDIQPISESLDRILKLEPKNFSWIENNEKDTGFIAQDVEKVIPEVVQETKGFVSIDSNEKEDTKYKTISYSKLTIYLVDAIKELTKRVEDLEERFVKK